MLAPPARNASASYDEAIARARAVMALDDETIASNAHTMLLDRGTRAPWAVVLFHGLTNHPGQFVEFAPLVHALGANVYAPRMPFHGYADRLTDALAGLRAQALVEKAYAAVDIACGLGERVAVLGISMGGLQCAYLGAYCEDVAVSVPIGPDFGLLHLPYGVTKALETVLLALPNIFMWWDPRVRAAQRPKTAYPRFCTHALMQTLLVGEAARDAAKKDAARAGRIATIVNRADPAVNNAITSEVVALWKRRRSSGIELIEYTDLPENHDIIDPDNDLARTQLVYPRLIEALAIRTP